MIDYKTFLEIKYLHQHRGLKCARIAGKLGLDERTVDNWLKEKRFRQRRPSIRRASLLDPFKDNIIRMLETYPYSAIQIFQRIRAGRVRPGRLGLLRFCLCRGNLPQAQLFCHGSLLQSDDVCGIYRFTDHGTFFGLSSERV